MKTPDETTKAIFRASRDGDASRLLSLIGTSQARLHTETPFGTPLHMSAANGNLLLVKALIDLGADINRKGGTFGGTAINEAASKGQLEVVKCLLDYQADLDTTEPERNPLFGAIYNGNLEIVKLLLSAGIDPTVRYSGEYMTNMDALDFAIERGQTSIAEFLRTLSPKSGYE
jgi:ankyrin repeat protein